MTSVLDAPATNPRLMLLVERDKRTPVSPLPGDRIILVRMHDDPNPILFGSTGTVRKVNTYGGTSLADTLDVAWDNGRTLALVVGLDQWATLTDRDHLVELLYIIKRLTLQEIGERVGLSRQRVQQILVARGVKRRPRGRRPKEAGDLTTVA